MMDFFSDPDKIRNQLKFDAGLERILRAVLAVHGYDWQWFIDQITAMKSPLANNEDQEHLRNVAKAFQNMKSLIEYLDVRGQKIQDQAKRAGLN